MIRNHLTKPQLRTAYNALIRLILEYWAPLFVDMSKKCCQKLDRVQRRFHHLLCDNGCHRDCLPSLSHRRRSLSFRFLKKIMLTDHVLHHLLPPNSTNESFQ